VVLEHLEATILEVLREQNPGTVIKREEIFLAGRFTKLEYTSPNHHAGTDVAILVIPRVCSVRGPFTSRTVQQDATFWIGHGSASKNILPALNWIESTLLIQKSRPKSRTGNIVRFAHVPNVTPQLALPVPRVLA
jgi:hypothetical protein